VSTVIGIVVMFCMIGVLLCHWCGRRMDKLARQIIDPGENPGDVDASHLRPIVLDHEEPGELEPLVTEALLILEEPSRVGACPKGGAPRTTSRTSTATAVSRPA
jgi:hypothetical protein